MYIRWYLIHCVRNSKILNNLFKSLFDYWRASTISFSFRLFTCTAFLVTFWIDMTWTRVSCCLVCSCISWFTHYFISHVSFVVTIPVSHFSASPKKGNRLILDCGFSDGDRFQVFEIWLSFQQLYCWMYGWLVGFKDAVYVGKLTQKCIEYKVWCKWLALEID